MTGDEFIKRQQVLLAALSEVVVGNLSSTITAAKLIIII
jgi:hypothetical protein